MPLASMTGFARSQGTAGDYHWSWELKSVNGKGLDLRLRLPQGWDAIEVPIRANAARHLMRGNISATLSVERNGALPAVRVNEDVLAALLETIRKVAKRVDASPPSLDGILGLKGVIEVGEAEASADERRAAEAAVAKGFEAALSDLVGARRDEGIALARILDARLVEIARLTAAAEASPARAPEAIRARLAEQVKSILGTGEKLDSDRLYQEAVLLAAKADVREELDRLKAHVEAARKLLAEGGPVGRKLDFLAQELNRESNTLCAKSNDISLTAIGLDLKSAVDQFREQVQNLE
ncbi:MAG TPA: YicC/YloC family endoribonuclease [Xanthobacteraceae bacterium]|nr:YicC/YloC family endoribonuclease [Xanthobacteraceae bacterium]